MNRCKEFFAQLGEFAFYGFLFGLAALFLGRQEGPNREYSGIDMSGPAVVALGLGIHAAVRLMWPKEHTRLNRLFRVAVYLSMISLGARFAVGVVDRWEHEPDPLPLYEAAAWVWGTALAAFVIALVICGCVQIGKTLRKKALFWSLIGM